MINQTTICIIAFLILVGLFVCRENFGTPIQNTVSQVAASQNMASQVAASQNMVSQVAASQNRASVNAVAASQNMASQVAASQNRASQVVASQNRASVNAVAASQNMASQVVASQNRASVNAVAASQNMASANDYISQCTNCNGRIIFDTCLLPIIPTCPSGYTLHPDNNGCVPQDKNTPLPICSRQINKSN